MCIAYLTGRGAAGNRLVPLLRLGIRLRLLPLHRSLHRCARTPCSAASAAATESSNRDNTRTDWDLPYALRKNHACETQLLFCMIVSVCLTVRCMRASTAVVVPRLIGRWGNRKLFQIWSNVAGLAFMATGQVGGACYPPTDRDIDSGRDSVTGTVIVRW